MIVRAENLLHALRLAAQAQHAAEVQAGYFMPSAFLAGIREVMSALEQHKPIEVHYPDPNSQGG